MLWQLPDMFPGQWKSKAQVIRRMTNSFIEGDFPLNEIMELGVPLMTTGLDPEGYSPQQRELQEWLSKTPRPLKRTPYVIQLAYISLTAIAYSTGSMGIGATSPEIQRYDDSAFAPGVGGYSII